MKTKNIIAIAVLVIGLGGIFATPWRSGKSIAQVNENKGWEYAGGTSAENDKSAKASGWANNFCHRDYISTKCKTDKEDKQ